MISKEDVKKKLDQMLSLEIEMEKKYKEISLKVKDKKFKGAFQQLVKDEQCHAKMVSKLIGLLKHWE